jgi:hypothetical protein
MEFAHAIDEITSGDLAGEYPALQYVPPQHDYWIDILARLGGKFQYSDLESEVVEVDGVRVRVATPRMLYLMKKDTARPKVSVGRGDAAAAAARPSRPHEPKARV